MKAESHRSTEEEEGVEGGAWFVVFKRKYRLFSGCLDWSGVRVRSFRGTLMRERHQDIHVVDGEEARLAIDHALVPVVVDLVGQGDDVALFEAQLAFVLWFKVVKCSAAGLVHGGCEWSETKRYQAGWVRIVNEALQRLHLYLE